MAAKMFMGMARRRDHSRYTMRRSDPAVIVALLSGAIALIASIVSGVVPEILKYFQDESEQHVTYIKQEAALSLCVEDLLKSLDDLEAATKTEGQYPPTIADPALMYDDQSMSKFGWLNPLEPKNYRYRYALISTVYRLSALLGWMEVYRRDMSYLRGTAQEQQAIAARWQAIRSDLANITYGKDTCIFPDEQRAIGEVMLSIPPYETAGAVPRTPTVIGYADFSSACLARRFTSLKRREGPRLNLFQTTTNDFRNFGYFMGRWILLPGRLETVRMGNHSVLPWT